MLDFLKRHTGRVIIVDTEEICAQCGSAKVLNVALLGAAIGSGALAFSLEQMQQTIRQRVPERYLVMNQKHFPWSSDSSTADGIRIGNKGFYADWVDIFG